MISNDASKAFAAVAARLEALARAIAVARAEAQVLARRGDPVRWRRARLLWPTFTGD